MYAVNLRLELFKDRVRLRPIHILYKNNWDFEGPTTPSEVDLDQYRSVTCRIEEAWPLRFHGMLCLVAIPSCPFDIRFPIYSMPNDAAIHLPLMNAKEAHSAVLPPSSRSVSRRNLDQQLGVVWS